MKRLFALISVFLLLSASALALEVSPIPNGISLAWEAADGAAYYDVYVDSVFIARLNSPCLSHTVKNLLADHSYQVAVAARSKSNEDIKAWFSNAVTGSWDGEYLWVNPTKEDNRGLMKELRMVVKTVQDPKYGQYYDVSVIRDGKSYRFFPLYPLGAAVQWTKYKSESPEAEVYRKCSEMINSSSVLKPSSWRVDRIELDHDGFSFSVISKAFGIEVETVNTFSFRLEDGVCMLDYAISGDKMFMSIAFVNPEPGSGGIYTLKRIS